MKKSMKVVLIMSSLIAILNILVVFIFSENLMGILNEQASNPDESMLLLFKKMLVMGLYSGMFIAILWLPIMVGYVILNKIKERKSKNI